MRIELAPTKSSRTYQVVTVRPVTVRDLVQAEQQSGKVEGLGYIVALMSLVCQFDGATLPPEDIQELDPRDFFGLCECLTSHLAALSDKPSSR
jgi:hypothetical protein